MDFENLYYNSTAKYEEGMYFDIKAFFENNDKVEEYAIKFIDDEFEIIIKKTKIDIESVVFDFLSCVSYSFLCVIQRENKEKEDEYRIYTKMKEKTEGVKIRILVPKS